MAATSGVATSLAWRNRLSISTLPVGSGMLKKYFDRCAIVARPDAVVATLDLCRHLVPPPRGQIQHVPRLEDAFPGTRFAELRIRVEIRVVAIHEAEIVHHRILGIRVQELGLCRIEQPEVLAAA